MMSWDTMSKINKKKCGKIKEVNILKILMKLENIFSGGS